MVTAQEAFLLSFHITYATLLAATELNGGFVTSKVPVAGSKLSLRIEKSFDEGRLKASSQQENTSYGASEIHSTWRLCHVSAMLRNKQSGIAPTIAVQTPDKHTEMVSGVLKFTDTWDETHEKVQELVRRTSA